MADAALVVVSERGAGLPLARPGFRGAVTAPAGALVTVAGGQYAAELVAQGLATWPAPAEPPSAPVEPVVQRPAKRKRER